MSKWIMLVHLNRRIRGDEESRRLSQSLPLTAFHYATDSPNPALGIEVEAETRADAERAAYDLVAVVLRPDGIDRVTGHDDTMQDRQVMLWLLGTRQHVRAWEIQLAEYIRIGWSGDARVDPLVWSAEVAHHMVLVAAAHLVRALKNADGRYTPMPEPMRREIEVLRNLHEHWDEQGPSFYNSKNPGPLQRSGRTFAEMYPGQSPYWWLGWSNTDGPTLGPGLRAEAIHQYLDALQAEVLAVAPDLARFVPTIEPSPWLGPSGKNHWWPRAPE
jgi:hypothetical protein